MIRKLVEVKKLWITVKIKDIPYSSEIYIDCVCDYCGTEVKRKLCTIIQGRKTIEKDCCSNPECKILKVQDVSLVKYNKPYFMYNINKTDKEREEGRNIEGYSQWRNDIFKRDNYMCDICGNINKIKEINAHHKDGYDWCKEKRLDINNGITLCDHCHNLFHNIYGSGNNTNLQYEEYKQNYSASQSSLNDLKEL